MPDHARLVVETAPGTFEIRETPIPEPGDDGAIVRLEACGVCATDLEIFHGDLPFVAYPLVPGHEPLGVIERLGRNARRRWQLSEGDRVAIKSSLGCRRCVLCSQSAGCIEFGEGRLPNYGFQSPDRAPGLWGGFATHLYLPPQAQFFPVDPAVPTGEASTFNALSNGVHWVAVGGVKSGDSVVILGPGARGLACVIAARRAGADRVVVTGLGNDRAKLELARDLGADTVLAVDPDTVAETVLDALPSGADIVIDTTPVATRSITDALGIARQRGTVVLAGLKGRRSVPSFFSDDVVNKELVLRGTASTPFAAMVDAVRIIESRRLPLDRLATHSFPLEEAEAGVRSLEAKRDGDRPVHVHLTMG
jgi:threonine dehydrogenase-like Zn-dependent dehydrogenase